MNCFLPWSFVCCFATFAFAVQLPYLKEIIQGRCYFLPPTTDGSASTCPDLVGSIMNVLESQLDANIEASDFETYLDQANFSSPPGKALFFLHFFGQQSPYYASFSAPPGFVSPEDTPGGALLKGLEFCGVDQRGNCSIEKSNAYWTFWEAAYAKFASQVQGHVQIVVEPMADVEFLQRSAVSNLQPDMVSSVTIYGSSTCASIGIAKLTRSLKDAGLNDVICKDDIAQFYIDSFSEEFTNMIEDDDDIGFASPQKGNQKARKFVPLTRISIIVVVVVGVIVLVLFHFAADGHSGKRSLFEAVKGFCMIPCEAIQQLWSIVYNALNNYYMNSFTSHDDDEIRTENSPLVNRGAHHDFFVAADSRVPASAVVRQ